MSFFGWFFTFLTFFNNFQLIQGVDQLLHVDQLWGVDKNTFFCSFSDVFCCFQVWNHWKRFKMSKKGWKWLKKVIWPDFGCAQHLKAGWNTEHMGLPKPLTSIKRNTHITKSRWPNEYDQNRLTWPKNSHRRTITFDIDQKYNKYYHNYKPQHVNMTENIQMKYSSIFWSSLEVNVCRCKFLVMFHC